MLDSYAHSQESCIKKEKPAQFPEEMSGFKKHPRLTITDKILLSSSLRWHHPDQVQRV
jgi:hypothetical protein